MFCRPYKDLLRERQRLFEQHRFFHWDLEFPEVFIDLDCAAWKENGGFDAVIGNPPYVRIQRVRHDQTDYLFQNYETSSRKIDLSLAFLELGFNRLNRMGLAGFITSSQWLKTELAPVVKTTN